MTKPRKLHGKRGRISYGFDKSTGDYTCEQLWFIDEDDNCHLISEKIAQTERAKTMTKYKELPACESADEFKVGDRVRVFRAYDVREGPVLAIKGDGVLHVKYKTGSEIHCHFKQARKLVPVEPREWEVKIMTNPLTNVELPFFNLKLDEKPPKRVREVLEGDDENT